MAAAASVLVGMLLIYTCKRRVDAITGRRPMVRESEIEVV